jgi:lysylphosphatidylglycerol synthetase-like protein (DUF2156 family)
MEEITANQKQNNSRGLKIASTLSWFWGILLLVSAFALGLPMVSQGGPLIFTLLLIVLGILFCVTGHGVRKHHPYASWLALISNIVSSILLILLRFQISPIGLLICIVIIVLVLKDWKVFHLQNAQQGASADSKNGRV